MFSLCQSTYLHGPSHSRNRAAQHRRRSKCLQCCCLLDKTSAKPNPRRLPRQPQVQLFETGQSLKQRISSGEFTKAPISDRGHTLRKQLAQYGPMGRLLALHMAASFWKYKQTVRRSIPEATGRMREMLGKPFFEPLYELYQKYGRIFKLSFGPRSFVVVSDPGMARQILLTCAKSYSKGILSDILEFVMGDGLIPANGEVWRNRRRAIIPAMHQAFIEKMIDNFRQCTDRALLKIEESVHRDDSIEMENFFSRLALDIIGQAVFHFDFDATTHNDPVIQAVYTVLREAETRSFSIFPWWELPFAQLLSPQQRKVVKALQTINNRLDMLVENVQEMLQQSKTPEQDEEICTLSILHFLLMKGENPSTKQLRDDLMTLMIAGHETTAAVLTWTFYELSRHPEIVVRMQQEIDSVFDDPQSIPSVKLRQLNLCTRVVAESMRLYPQPPVLIRRTLEPVDLGPYSLPAGVDVFLSVWNIHRSDVLWDRPHEFDPDRFQSLAQNGGIMPNEVTENFRFLPFGGGRRKCIGDQFALLESLYIIASIIGKYDIVRVPQAPEVQMTTGATIHALNGVHLTFRKRDKLPQSKEHQSLQPIPAPIHHPSSRCPFPHH